MLKGNNIVTYGTYMIVATLVSSLFAYTYQVLMGRLLTTEEYGTLISLTSIGTILSVPTGAIGTTVAKFISKHNASNNAGEIRYLWESAYKKFLVVGFASFALLLIFSNEISSFLGGVGWTYVAISFVGITVAFSSSVNTATLQGLERFVKLGAVGIITSILRVAIALLLILIFVNYALYGAILGNVISLILGFLITYFLLLELKKQTLKIVKERFANFTYYTLIWNLSYALLLFVAPVLAKHYLSATDAGRFSAVFILASIIIYAPAGINTVMYPKTSYLYEQKKKHFDLFLKALAFNIIITGSVVLVYMFYPQLTISILFGTKYSYAAKYLPLYGIAMMIMSVLALVVTYSISVNNLKVVYLAIGTAIIQLILIIINHFSTSSIILDILISNIIGIIGVTGYLIIQKLRKSRKIHYF